ncbi:MAG TPA: HAD family phosphatase [Ruania sp.]|nr:HAD family phosphatase [Ruania sp.]
MTQIDTVIFDFGQVLVRWDPRQVWQGEYSPEEIDQLLEELDFSAINRALDAGARWAELRPEVAARVGARVADMDTYMEHYPRSLLGPVTGSAELVRDVQRAGARTVGLTNWSAETFHHAPSVAPVIDTLDDVLVSGRAGLSKPDPGIYALAQERFGLEAARTAFLDDSPANITAAEQAGWHGHVFTSADSARQWLNTLGVAV